MCFVQNSNATAGSSSSQASAPWKASPTTSEPSSIVSAPSMKAIISGSSAASAKLNSHQLKVSLNLKRATEQPQPFRTETELPVSMLGLTATESALSVT